MILLLLVFIVSPKLSSLSNLEDIIAEIRGNGDVLIEVHLLIYNTGRCERRGECFFWQANCDTVDLWTGPQGEESDP